MRNVRRTATWAFAACASCIAMRAEAGEADRSKAVLPVRLSDRFMLPSGRKDQYGNLVVERDGARISPVTGYPYEIWLREPRMEFVLIPGGEFVMGSNISRADEKPAHRAKVSCFYLAKYETTEQHWQAFIDANPQWDKSRVKETTFIGKYLEHWRGRRYADGTADRPVRCVSWNMAKAYCGWVGGRLPTEAEWERAMRGTDARVYPWGNDWDRTKCNCAAYWADRDLPDRMARKKASQDNALGPMDVAAVGTFPSDLGPYGVFDMAGNVSEWTSSMWLPYPYNVDDGRETAVPPGLRVVRGGHFLAHDGYCRASYRPGHVVTTCHAAFGFRVCVSVRGSE